MKRQKFRCFLYYGICLSPTGSRSVVCLAPLQWQGRTSCEVRTCNFLEPQECKLMWCETLQRGFYICGLNCITCRLVYLWDTANCSCFYKREAYLTFILLTWTIWRAPSKWRMGFNSPFKGLMTRLMAVTNWSVGVPSCGTSVVGHRAVWCCMLYSTNASVQTDY